MGKLLMSKVSHVVTWIMQEKEKSKAALFSGGTVDSKHVRLEALERNVRPHHRCDLKDELSVLVLHCC